MTTPADQRPEVTNEDLHTPAWVTRIADRMSTLWVGRIAVEMAQALRRVEIFDRSMTIAAQFFTSVFPLLILMGLWIGGSQVQEVTDEIDMPAGTAAVIESAVTGNSSGAFGVVGTLFVIVSGTSLSRALTRAFAIVWGRPRPKSRPANAWRWVAVLTTLALFLVVSPVIGRIAADIPPSGGFWQLLGIAAADVGLALFVPWVLLEGHITFRQLLPGAALFAVAMVTARPFVQLYMPIALDKSAGSYGTIGVAFTYISYLYAVSFAFLGCAVIGQVLASDDSWFGRWCRREPVRRVKAMA